MIIGDKTRKRDMLMISVLLMLGLRFITSLIHAVYPVTSPHIWRQVDTLNIGLRYALRWTVENPDFSWWMPAVLGSGDTRGITPMEFPFLNLLGATGFLCAGGNIEFGRILAHLLALGLNVFLVVKVWQTWSKNQNLRGAAIAALMAPVVSFASPYTAKFMPDLPSMLFALWGTGLIWRLHPSGMIPLALGLLMKPTSITVPALLLLHPQNTRVWRGQIGFVMLALVAPLLWYLKVVPWLSSQLEITPVFALHEGRNHWEGIKEFWSSGEVWDVLGFHSVFQYGWLLVMVAVIVSRWQRASIRILWMPLGVLGLQATIIGALSGSHARMHSYYLIGLTPVAALIIYQVWDMIPQRWFRVVLALGLIVRTADAGIADIQGLVRPPEAQMLFAECRELRDLTKEVPWHTGIAFRSPAEEYAFLAQCFGERTGSMTSKYGFFHKSEPLPAGCQIMRESQHLVIASCL